MKTKANTLALVLTAALVCVPSCQNFGSYLECLTASNREECLIGKGIEQAVAYLADAKNLNSTEAADKFASRWSKIQTTVKTAQTLGVKIPDSVKKSYNETMVRIVKHKYFESESLRTAMKNAEFLK